MPVDVHSVTARTSMWGIFEAFTALGIAPTPPVDKAHQRLVDALAAFDARQAPGADDVALAVLAAVEAGTDPAADHTVQQLLAAQAIAGRHGLRGEIEAALVDLLRAAVTEHAGPLVEALRSPFTDAVAELSGAHEVLGDIDLDDAEHIIRQGASATTAWADAKRAIEIIGAAADGWRALVAFITGRSTDKRYRLITIAEVPADRWITDGLDLAPADPWAAVSAGHQLRLPSIDEYAAGVAAVEDARRAAADANAKHRRPVRAAS